MTAVDADGAGPAVEDAPIADASVEDTAVEEAAQGDPAAEDAVVDGADPDLIRQIAVLQSKVDELAYREHERAAREHERAAFRESVIDRLHAENQTLRRGELDVMFQPVRDGVVALHDLARRAAGQYRRTEQPTAERGAALLEAVADEAADVLARLGVSRIEPVAGELFDPGRHRGVGTAPAPHPWQDNTIVEVSAIGFALAEKVIRRAEVVVARHHGGEQGEEHQ